MRSDVRQAVWHARAHDLLAQPVSLTPCGDLSAAAWITASDLPWQQLVTFGPQEFPTYARLRFLPDPTSPGQEEPEPGVDDPDEYDLLRIALDVLGEHTHTPEDLYFCMWDGWGTPPALSGLPTVTVPERSYFLIRGALVDFGDWQTPERMPTGHGFDPLNRPGSDGGSQSMEDESHVSTQEVRR
jgi:hypothetical protein